MWNKTGIYIASSLSSELKSIYKAQNYLTKVNNQHIKVGITKDSFKSRRICYLDNFDNEVEFTPIVEVEIEDLKKAEKLILTQIKNKFYKVGKAREWFNTNNKEEIISIISSTLQAERIYHTMLL